MTIRENMTMREKVAMAISRTGTIPLLEAYNLADAAKIAFLEAAAEQGWHMRPDEATEEMVGVVVDACRAEDIEIFREDEDALPGVVWKAMLAAAPEFEWDK